MLQADIVERLYVETHLVTITTESVRCKSPTAIEAITEIAKETPKEVTKEDKAKENLPCKVVLKKLTKSNKYYIEIRKNNRFLTSIFKKRCSL